MYDATLLQIGDNAQVFVDNALIEQVDGVTRRWHKPVRLGNEPVLSADRPWEITPYFTYSNFNVLRDPTTGVIKCWYEDIGPLTPHIHKHPWKNRMLYAESTNGIDFHKPALGRVFIDGRDTNVFAGYVEGAQPDAANPWADVGIHSAAIVIDPTGADQRYRMLFSQAREHGGLQIVCAYSSDGIGWQPYDETPSFGTANGHLSDVSTIEFDPRTKLFFHYTRHGGMSLAGVPSSSPGHSWEEGARFRTFFPGRPDLMNKRRVFRTVSADFLHWDDPVAISTPDELLDNLDAAHYGMGHFRVGATHFGTLGVLHYVDNEMDVRLIYSHDGYCWQPANPGHAFLEPRDQHWDRHMVSIVSPPVRVGDQWYFYHGGSLAHHDWWWAGPNELDHDEARFPNEQVRFGMGVAALRFEGMVSLEAVAPRTGRLVTRPLRFEGSGLRINARTKTNGSIRVAICDSDGRVVPGYSLEECIPFNGDDVRHSVRWTSGADLARPTSAAPFRKIIFSLDNAEIFGFVVDGRA